MHVRCAAAEHADAEHSFIITMMKPAVYVPWFQIPAVIVPRW